MPHLANPPPSLFLFWAGERRGGERRDGVSSGPVGLKLQQRGKKGREGGRGITKLSVCNREDEIQTGSPERDFPILLYQKYTYIDAVYIQTSCVSLDEILIFLLGK